MTIELRFQPYRLFPYERELARREVSTLGLKIIRADDRSIFAAGSADSRSLRRLTYFQEVVMDGKSLEPHAAGLERRHLQRHSPRHAPRQATRYLVHGLHEYKGKFHPQMVRAFMNLLDVGASDLVMDPFMGSGTTLVEAAMLGARSAGADLSPIALLLTQAKLSVLAHPNRGSLHDALEAWGAETIRAMDAAYQSATETPIEGLSEESIGYLRSWFDPRAYAALSAALAGLRSVVRDHALHQVASVCVSSVLRRTSLQAPEDLRVRRRSATSIPEPIVPLLELAIAKAANAVRETAEHEELRVDAICELLDVTVPNSLARLRGNAKSAVVITSPPYATALPYIDTDRLSIVALGLGASTDLHRLEASLVGSREWSAREQREWENRLADTNASLPTSVSDLCRAIVSSSGSSAGFRKRAVPALLFRYIFQMQDAFRELRLALRPGERAVFIVGTNRTGRGPTEVVIDTPRLLADTAARVGFVLDELIPLETWPRYGLHQANSVASESAVMLSAV